MNLDNIAARKAVYEATLFPSLQTAWRQACTQAPINANFMAINLIQFTSAREQFVLKASTCPRSLAEDTRHWMLYDLSKPRNMSVQYFQKRINEICKYFPHMPRPKDIIPVTPRLPAPDENDKIAILHNACPKFWHDEQARTNQLDLNLKEVLSYYSILKSIESGSDDNKIRRKKNNRMFDPLRKNRRDKHAFSLVTSIFLVLLVQVPKRMDHLEYVSHAIVVDSKSLRQPYK